MSDSLWPHGLQHTRLSCLSLSPRACSNSCPLGWWCHPNISSFVSPFFSCSQSFPALGCFPMSRLCIRWPKYWSFSFSISPSNEYSRLISFRIDWFDPFCPRDCQQSSPAPQLESISSSALNLLYGPALTSVHMSSYRAYQREWYSLLASRRYFSPSRVPLELTSSHWRVAIANDWDILVYWYGRKYSISHTE